MEEHKIKLTVDTGNSTKDVEKLNHALEGTQDELIPLTTLMGDMEDKLMLMAHAGDTTSDEFQRLAQEVAGMRQTIRLTDEGIEAMSFTMSQKLGGALGGVASGFEAFQGVMGAFGANTEEVEKALLKVQSAMAIAQGVQGVREAIPVFKALKTDILSSALAQNVLTGAQKLYNLVVGKSTGAMKALKLAIAASGVGALVMILMEAVGALDLFSSSTEDAEAEQKKLEKQLEETNKQIESQKNQTNNLSAILESRTKQDIANAKLRGASEKELLQIEKDADKDRLRILESQEKQAQKLYLTKSKYGSNEEFLAAEKALTEASKAASQARIDIASKEADEVYQKRQEANDKAKDANQKANDDRKQSLEEIAQAEKEYQDSLLTDKDLEIKNATEKYDALIAKAKKYKQDTTELEDAQRNELNNIKVKYAQEQIDLNDKIAEDKRIAQEEANAKELEREQSQADALKEIKYARIAREKGEDVAKNLADIDAINATYNERLELFKGNSLLEQTAFIEKEDALKTLDAQYKQEQKVREAQARNDKADIVRSGFELVGNLASAFAGKSRKAQKTAFNIQKGVNIATATIDTYKAANMALASSPPPLSYVFAALAIGAGIANIAKIAKTKFDDSGSGGGGGGGAISAGGGGGGGSAPVSTPEFNIVGNSPVAALAQMSTQPQQAFVVSGEVTSAQSLDRNRVSNATL
jgi:hypothetical protein